MGFSRLPVIGLFMALVTTAFLLVANFNQSPTPASLAKDAPGQSRSPGLVVVAAGDIACAPEDPGFNNGLGTKERCQMAATADLVASANPSLVLPLGDNQYERGELANYQASYQPTWGRFDPISRPIAGNHEYYGPDKNAADYFDYFGELAGDRQKGYYSYDQGDWHFIALNSNCKYIGGCEMGSPQQQWLKQDLAQNNKACTLAYWHHPLYSSGAHGNQRQMADLWQTLYDGGAEVILSGHDHLYERFAPQDAQAKLDTDRGIRQFVIGTGGKSLYPFRTLQPNSEVRAMGVYGVLKMELQPDGYRWRFLAANTTEFNEQGQDRCH
ncbi:MULTISPECIES: metallophosphoesterase [unclassified Synechocystis]|uniref:metallophosphoesterase family protein n=1 Tax=unclassified Synechocystis TaxID=2640012 RepID=UPI0003F753B1|nr:MULTISPECIES: metallophosphoesterase [unclassified Synechocystis]AIE76035.1 Acid phosphatase [Synechocystis sp. PCC 6714]MCT0255059.1 metallophosphoesterase [Synechocystis sp. CS-94]